MMNFTPALAATSRGNFFPPSIFVFQIKKLPEFPGVRKMLPERGSYVLKHVTFHVTETVFKLKHVKPVKL